MKAFHYVSLVVIITLLTVISACTPGAPDPSTTPTAATSKTTVPTSNLPPLTSQSASQDAAWAKIVEAAKKEGNLTIYSFNFVGDIGLAVSKAFKDEYNITVD
ncbi:MAG: hypothetical protein Q7R34_12115, partial [Dehalococcoidia bacterium]|nr:hypothetical protein [Dehalococcoidia bacterium]